MPRAVRKGTDARKRRDLSVGAVRRPSLSPRVDRIAGGVGKTGAGRCSARAL